MFWDRFVGLCAQQNKSPNFVINEIGAASSGAVTGWKKGSMPRPKVLRQIADYFDVPVEYLTGETDEKQKKPLGDTEGLSEREKKMLEVFHSLTKEQQDLILALGNK